MLPFQCKRRAGSSRWGEKPARPRAARVAALQFAARRAARYVAPSDM